jgi:hypothetical protein
VLYEEIFTFRPVFDSVIVARFCPDRPEEYFNRGNAKFLENDLPEPCVITATSISLKPTNQARPLQPRPCAGKLERITLKL